jgi:ABC-type glutathione transport system ATPase component
MNTGSLPSRPREGWLVEARDVYRSFGRTPALRAAPLSVAPGEIVAVMGPSGSGKSTLLHCLAGIFEPGQGRGVVRRPSARPARRCRGHAAAPYAFGFVFQFGQLVPELTAADNIALPLLLNRVGHRAAYKSAASWLRRLDLKRPGRQALRRAVRRAGPAGGARQSAGDRGHSNQCSSSSATVRVREPLCWPVPTSSSKRASTCLARASKLSSGRPPAGSHIACGPSGDRGRRRPGPGGRASLADHAASVVLVMAPPSEEGRENDDRASRASGLAR